jgi:hypothetical protein
MMLILEMVNGSHSCYGQQVADSDVFQHLHVQFL